MVKVKKLICMLAIMGLMVCAPLSAACQDCSGCPISDTCDGGASDNVGERCSSSDDDSDSGGCGGCPDAGSCGK